MSAPKAPTPQDFEDALTVIDRATLYARSLRAMAAGLCVYASPENRKDCDAMHTTTAEFLMWLEQKQIELRTAETRREQEQTDGAALIH